MDRRKRYRQTVALMSMLSETKIIDNVDIATFDGNGEKLLSLIVGIDPVQVGSGDPSPDNVRPISGWDSVEVKRTGVNVGRIYGYSASNPASSTAALTTSNAYGTTISTTDGTSDKLIVTQTDHSATQPDNFRNGYISIGCDSLENGKAYWFSAKIKITSNPLNVNSIRALWNGLNGETLNISNGIISGQIHPIEYGARQYLEIRCCGASFELCDVMFSLVETADYHPYQGQSYQIQLGQTVYGGTLDVTGGKMYVRPYFTSYNGQALIGPWVSSMDAYMPSASPTVGAQVVDMGGAVTEITLDPVTISTIAGQTNNVWADTGKIIFLEYEA